MRLRVRVYFVKGLGTRLHALQLEDRGHITVGLLPLAINVKHSSSNLRSMRAWRREKRPGFEATRTYVRVRRVHRAGCGLRAAALPAG